ncbi:MAG: V-type ATPase subunit [Pyramidobacter sp.]
MTVPSIRGGGSTSAASVGEETNYDYVNARLRARSRSFLTSATLTEMAAASLADSEKIILQSAYAPVYQRNFMFSGMPLADRLEAAVTAETAQRCRDLKSWAKGEIRLLLPVLSVQSDLENGQLFLRALLSGRTDFIPSVPGCGELTEDFWQSLNAANGSRSAIAELCRYDPSRQSDMLSGAVSELDRTGHIWDAEWFFMKNLMQLARGTLTRHSGESFRIVKRYLALLTDLLNIRIWLGLHIAADSRDAEVHYLDGGTISEERLLFTDKFKALLKDTFWQISTETEAAQLAALEKKFLAWQISLRLQNPLGIQVIVSYLARLYCEWRNLTTLFSALQCGLPREMVQNVLFTDF